MHHPAMDQPGSLASVEARQPPINHFHWQTCCILLLLLGYALQTIRLQTRHGSRQRIYDVICGYIEVGLPAPANRLLEQLVGGWKDRAENAEPFLPARR